MPDKVELYVNKMRIEHFEKYRIDADLYTPADAFELELANPETAVAAGMSCELRINGELELTGIIDQVHRKVLKSKSLLSVAGRDLMGLLVDSYCDPSTWRPVEGMKLKALAELLLKPVPFINRKDIKYQANIVGKLKGKKSSSAISICDALDTAQRIGQIEAGMTIFEVLKNYALSRGMLFYCEPKGTLVFGRPLTDGAPEYHLQMLKSGRGNNVIESDVTADIARRYKRVIVVAQQQGYEGESDPAKLNVRGEHTDPTFPFDKLYVAKECNDNVSPAMRARLIMEHQRREGMRYCYTVGRHSQNGKNWGINKFCSIQDEPQGLNGNYLIYGRTFELSKEEGPTTRLRLGEPGLVA